MVPGGFFVALSCYVTAVQVADALCGSNFTSITPGKLQRNVLNVKGVARSYLLYSPLSARTSNSIPRPLVLNFHGNPSTAQQHFDYTQMESKAESQGFYLAYPDGLMVSNGQSWNAGGCCAGATADDVAFALAVVSDVKGRACIAQSQVFSTGWSAGGYFSVYLACVAAPTFSAIAVIGGLAGVIPVMRPHVPSPPRHACS